MTEYIVDIEKDLSVEKALQVVRSGAKLKLSERVVQKVNECRSYLDNRMAESDEAIYGINTGFGSLCNTVINKSELSTLQRNLVISHACGLGEEVPQEIVKLMIFLKIKGLSFGHSGVALTTIERLVNFFNHDIIPVVYQQGSLGASGDLAPLAHLSLPLIGEGEVYFKGNKVSSSQMLKENRWEPLALQSKEGLALLNGTQFMSAYATFCVCEAIDLSEKADFIAATSLDAYDGRIEPFKDSVHLVRNHKGQLTVARNVRSYLEGSELIVQEKKHVQDPYSFRCVPQVHGATRDTIDYVKSVVENEINAVTDNPTIFPEDDDVISAGNFHGQPLALVLDYLSIALAELGSISERRIFKLVSGTRELPPFLSGNPGLNSGFMIPQYAAAGVASQNKQLAVPASIDSIDSSNGQEDHVSMGANAATKCHRVVENVWSILGVEYFNACQALDFRKPKKSSEKIEAVKNQFRDLIPYITDDVYMHQEMKKSISYVRSLQLSE